MNEPLHDPNEIDPYNDLGDSLKTLRPRTPQIDWDAIKDARAERDSTLPLAITSRSPWAAYGPFAVAACVGVAAGAAFTFFAMNWLILNDLQAKVTRLEQEASKVALAPNVSQPAPERASTESDPELDLYLRLETPQLSVGAYRGRPDRLINASSNSSRSASTSSPANNITPDSNRAITPSKIDAEQHQSGKVLNQMQLLNELRQSIY